MNHLVDNISLVHPNDLPEIPCECDQCGFTGNDQEVFYYPATGDNLCKSCILEDLDIMEEYDGYRTEFKDADIQEYKSKN